MNINVTIVIVAITVIVSIIALRDERLERKLIFNPYIIYRRREYWRFLTAVLIHGNYLHLGLNMFVLYQFEKNKNNIHYNALGASGAVSAVVFAYIGVVPTQNFWLLGALPVPAFAYGILFLILSWVMARKGQDNIGHDAHFFGALYGIMYIFIIQPSQLPRFFESINYYIQHLF